MGDKRANQRRKRISPIPILRKRVREKKERKKKEESSEGLKQSTHRAERNGIII